MASISPLPQRPDASPPPITSTWPSDSFTEQMAPVTARIPCVILIPSNAGPAAVEVHRISPLRPTTISPFVPRSINACHFSCLCIWMLSMPARISLPTKWLMFGRKTTSHEVGSAQCNSSVEKRRAALFGDWNG